MAEDKKINLEEKKEEVAEEKAAMVEVEEKDDLGGSRDEKFELEELPDDVKKKLEESKKNKLTNIKSKKKKKKTDKKVAVGKAFIKATYNNTIVTLTDLNGNVLSWASAGMAGFKGPKKSTPYAAQIIVRIAVEKAKPFGLREVSVFVKGVGTGRESAVRALNANGLDITYIKDITPVPHNGCRPKKPRRV